MRRLLLPLVIVMGALGGCRSPLEHPPPALLTKHFPAPAAITRLPIPAAHDTVRVIWRVGARDLLGYIVTVEARSRSGRFSVWIVFDERCRVTAVTLPGYPYREGRGVLSPGFRQRFVGESSAEGLDLRVDAVSGATLSSHAVTAAVAQALQALRATPGSPSTER